MSASQVKWTAFCFLSIFAAINFPYWNELRVTLEDSSLENRSSVKFMVGLGIFGAILSIFYSGGICCTFKNMALGDMTIFLTFGPVLAAYISMFFVMKKYGSSAD